MRSSTATREALEKGFSHPVNMAGGMIEWREKKLKTEI
jgi:rhodanese-related sulfurtransferase